MTLAWLAILNPVAGSRHSARWLQKLTTRIKLELSAQVIFTEGPGHARELAAGSKSFDGLAVFGGDGTVSEVVNGMSLASQRLLLLAGGTGNGLARDLKLTSFDSSFAAVRTKRIRNLDLIKVTFHIEGKQHSRMEISTAAVGYAAEVVVLSNKHFKWMGPFCYPMAATLQAARQQVFRITVRLEENVISEQQLSNIMVNNTRHAGNFSAFRQSLPDDARMDVLLARNDFASQMLHNLAVLSKTYVYAAGQELATRAIHLVMPDKARLMIDGELWDDVTEARFEILPGLLQCVA
jgi:diacylglycerol kinase family enzyme